MAECRFCFAFEFWNDSLRQCLTKFDSPLVERIDVPDSSLGEDRVLVEGDELAQDFRCELLGENRIRRTVALEDAVGHKPIRRAFSFDLLRRFAESQSLGLREDIRQQHVVVPADRIQCFGKTDKVARDQPRALMDQLIERMLTVGPRLAPVDGAGIVIDRRPFERDMFTVALHGQLLQICRKPLQVLLVGQNGNRLCAEEVVVPDGEQSHQHRQVAFERSAAEVFVYLVKAIQHRAEILGADG